jgi:thiamine biosynthesis lipoprotein
VKPVIYLLVAVAVVALVVKAIDDRAPVPEPWESRYRHGATEIEGGDYGSRLVEIREAVMGTRFVLEIYAPDPQTVQVARVAAWGRIWELERHLSTWIADSELSQINRKAAQGPRPMSVDVHRVLKAAESAWRESGGAFDPTVGPLIALWKPLATLDRMPADEAIGAARALVGFDGVVVDHDRATVAFAREGMALDVGGIAKGYAADEACRAALAAGAVACRVNAGGDMAARGKHPESEAGFEVEVRDPMGRSAESLENSAFHIAAGAVATSGNYERYTEIDGKRYSHIVDPRTGRPVPDAVVQVTVIAPDGARADALATAFTVLGVEGGRNLAETLDGVEALFLVRDGEGFRRLPTSGFPGGR